MQVKPWQMIVIVLGLLIGGGGILWASLGNESVDVSHVIHCVDVETGQIYRIDTSKSPVVLPARHPTTGRICLVRCSKDEHGSWIVGPRDRSTLAMLDKDVKNVAINSETGELQGTIKAPIDYVKAK
jgi:hypothetical protein